MYHYACEFSTLAEKKKMRVIINNRPILLVIHQEHPYAIADKCPHQGYSLFTGKYDSGIIACKEHGLQIDVTSGNVANPLKAKALRMEEQDQSIKTYKTIVDDGKVMIELL